MLDLSRLERLKLTRRPFSQRFLGRMLGANYHYFPGIDLSLTGSERIPSEPVIVARIPSSPYKLITPNNIKENIRRYGCFNVIPVFGRAPEILAALPAPDRVFIGGSSGSLDKIVRLVAGELTEGGCLVINGVIEKTIRTAPQYMRQNGFSVTQSMIQMSRKSEQGETQNYNPITVMAGTR